MTQSGGHPDAGGMAHDGSNIEEDVPLEEAFDFERFVELICSTDFNNASYLDGFTDAGQDLLKWLTVYQAARASWREKSTCFFAVVHAAFKYWWKPEPENAEVFSMDTGQHRVVMSKELEDDLREEEDSHCCASFAWARKSLGGYSQSISS
jgi:hypothetical protein